MGDKQVLQRGNRVTIDSKGNRTSEPLADGEVDAQIAANKRRFGAALADAAADSTVGRMQRMPNRRDTPENGMKCGGKVKKYAKGGSVDGVAQRGKTRGKYI
ncbi:hypothetical protein K0U83_25500 [bacterium]|nr:hypothetical protein [bacterium]